MKEGFIGGKIFEKSIFEKCLKRKENEMFKIAGKKFTSKRCFSSSGCVFSLSEFPGGHHVDGLQPV